jgi:aminoglycoside phosphotransferase (APT) family kinase protein
MTSSVWPEAVDPVRLAAWMDAQGLGEGPLGEARLLTGGTQNILVLFTRGGRGYVLRRPPAQPRAMADATIAREARVLAALAGSAVPHPRLIAACADASVLGAAFFLMEPVEGFNPSGQPLPALHASDPSIRHAMGLAAVDALLRLGEVDPTAAGLGDFGKPQGFLERQVPRWRAQLEGCKEHAGWPGADGLPGVVALGEWLEANRPEASAPGILHGDFHLSNLMYRPDGPAVAAVIDWELATLGDPLLDLGWLIATWPDASGQGAGTIHITPWDGFPSTNELIAHYRARSPRDLSAIDWYAALAGYKLAILLEASYARSCAGKGSRAVGDKHHASAQKLIQRALARTDSR